MYPLPHIKNSNLTQQQKNEIYRHVAPYNQPPKTMAYRPHNGSHTIIIPDFPAGIIVRTTTEAVEKWPETKCTDVFFSLDLPPNVATKSMWKQRGYAIIDGEEPVAHVRRNPLGAKKTRFKTGVYDLMQCRKIQGRKAETRRQAYLSAATLISRIAHGRGRDTSRLRSFWMAWKQKQRPRQLFGKEKKK